MRRRFVVIFGHFQLITGRAQVSVYLGRGMSAIRSLQIIGSRKLGGAESFFMRLHQAIQSRQDLASLAVVPPKSELLAALAEPYRTRAMRSVFDPFSKYGLSRLIRQEQPDLVQTWMGRATRLVKLDPKQGPVHVARLGGFYNPSQYRHAHAWIGNTQAICQYLLEQGFPANRVFYISNFVPEPDWVSEEGLVEYRRQLGLTEADSVIFALGRLHENKAFDTLIDAFTRLPEEVNGRRLHLLIAGDGPLRAAIEQQVALSNAQARIHLLGWQSSPTPWFQLADLFVCPSRHEPLGNVILEAWAHRVPVLSTRSSGALELIEEGVSGALVDIDRPDAMAAQIDACLQLPSLERTHWVESAYAHLQAHYGEQPILDAYQALYQKLLSRSL